MPTVPVPPDACRPSSGLDNYAAQAGEGSGGRLCQSAKVVRHG